MPGYFYPRSPCGERRKVRVIEPGLVNISIHALLAESDQQPNNQEHPSSLFLSTLSLRRATSTPAKPFSTSDISIHALLAESDFFIHHNLNLPSISIHALLAESDQKWPKHQTQTQNFYPRSPCGERLDDLIS